ncbi:TonB family protein [Simiduia litorea]|uniref:TonB family protein n=1 Tax=Simiduia litorea TaxID=1435348 RepID=UPI0036F306FB
MNILDTTYIGSVKAAFALCLALVCTPLLAQTNNYSALTQASQPQFVARLETPSAPDQGSLLGRTPAATMEYRIVSERINNRRFFKLIADAIAVNSDAKTLAKNATYISRSRSAVPVELQPNDAISFAFDGKNTVVMSLNGVQLASYQSADFFRMLLSTWVGEVPISSRFKREILGKETPPKDVADLFIASAPSAERKLAIAQALATPAPVEAVATTSVAAATAAVTSAPAAKIASVPTPQPKATKAPAPVSTPTPAAVKVETKPEPKVAVAPAAKAPVKTPEAKPSPTPVAKAETEKSKPASAPAVVAKPAPVELSEEEEARRLLLRQEYLKGLNRDINIQKHLPAAAFTRRAEGSVRLAIALDKNGKLLKVEVVEPSRYSMFNDQALEAVSNAQPFTPPPADLESDPFEFETTLYYDLPL